LRLQEPPERLAALLREHDRLLKKIGQAKKGLARMSERIAEVARTLAREHELVAECRRLDSDIHALFAELLSRKGNRQHRETRHLVAALYRMLQEVGVLSPLDPWEDGGNGQADVPDPSAGPFGAEARGDDGRPRFDAGGFSASRPGGEPANQSLRGLFRDLALALHPDKVHDADEKARRTEVMKEISRAYGDRDFARLLDLKRIWMDGGTAAESGDEIDRRCANVERMNAALRGQLKDLTRESKALRRSPPAQMLKDIRRSPEGNRKDPIAALIARTHAERDRLRELRDFVVSFRDGKITSDELARGPQSMRGEASEEDDDPEALEALADMLFGGPMERPVRPRRRRRGGRQGRDVRPGDIPF